MPERSSKKKARKKSVKKTIEGDENEVAANIVELATGADNKGKNPAAIALGRLGGLKGGNARAKKLSAKKRSEIAKKAAMARWSKKS